MSIEVYRHHAIADSLAATPVEELKAAERSVLGVQLSAGLGPE